MDIAALATRPQVLSILIVLAVASVQADDGPNPRSETLHHSDSRHLTGRLVGDATTGFGFLATGAAQAIRLDQGATVTFEGPQPGPSLGVPPFRVELGLSQQLSGKLGVVTADSVRLVEVVGGGPILIARPGVRAVIQHPGDALVVQDGFETLDTTRWEVAGEPTLVPDPHVAGTNSLKLPATGASVTCRFSRPVGSGRVELAFLDDKVVAAGPQWFVDLSFRGPSGPETVRVLLGWGEESLAVESSGGPALAVQRLARRPGWHRLNLRFGPEQTEIAVDGNELAHGKGPGGPLLSLRLGSATPGKTTPMAGVAGYFDDLRIVQFAEPTGGFEVDATQDEVRLVSGDQVFGTLRSADGDRVVVSVISKDVSFAWSEVSGLYFRRAPVQGDPIDGLLVRLEWRSAPGHDPSDLDQIEGVLTAVTDSCVSIATPYSGLLSIARDRLVRLRVVGSGRRIVLDPTAHHLGNEISNAPPVLDPPQPEGGVLTQSFTIDKVPPGPAFLALDVVQVVGEASGLPFATEVKNGFLRTNVKINGILIDYLNRHISSKNESPERIRLAIPAGLLHPGANQLRIEQTGRENDPDEFDDLGVLGIAVEFAPARPATPSPEKP